MSSLKRAEAVELNRVATISLQDGRLDEAIKDYELAIELDPNFSLPYSNLGIAFRQNGELEKAFNFINRAIGLDPRNEMAHSNLGVILADLGRIELAVEAQSRAIDLKPDFLEPYFNRANLFVLQRKLDQAIIDFDKVLFLNPNHYQAKWNRALALLLSGDLLAGFRAFESRWEIPAFCGEEKFSQRLWLGHEPLIGKSIFLHSEQGLGDSLQFCRYASLAKMMGASKVILGVQEPLKRIMGSLEGADLVVTRGDVLPHFDFHCPMMSLPLAFNTSLEAIPARQSYLAADPIKVAYWRQKLGSHKRLRVGLVWSGGFRPNQPELWEINRRRNIPLQHFEELNIENIDFVSLQKGAEPEADLEKLNLEKWTGPNIANYVSELNDFSDTAALIENLDLVISVDTSTAHLAAALGKPVWLLNRFDTCWRWLLDRSDSPWYPTVKLYRQPMIGDWSSVISMVKSDLIKFAENSHLD